MMKVFLSIAIVVVSVMALAFDISNANAQPGSSPAFDPNFVRLTPERTLQGNNSNQFLGGLIQNLGPIEGPDDKYGDVVIWGMPIKGTQFWPGNPVFAGGPSFSVPSQPPILNIGYGDSRYQVVHMHGWKHAPDLIANDNALIVAKDWMRYEDSASKAIVIGYTWSSEHDTAGYPQSSPVEIRMPNRSFSDLFLEGLTVDGGGKSSSRMTLYGGAERLDTVRFHSQTILPPAFEDTLVLPESSSSITSPVAFDFDRDGIPDIVSAVRGSGSYLQVVYGRVMGDSNWRPDSIVYTKVAQNILTLMTMDFLMSDGVPDLILSTADTIYIFSGAKRHQAPFALQEADLKIPSPAKLDPEHFGARDNGGMQQWGEQLVDVGNINGSGEHALATAALFPPYPTNPLYQQAYLFIYSGGKAADEKVDAVFMDESDPTHEIFESFDTVSVADGEPVSILVGDGGYSGGPSGALWYLRGSTTIPHTPDPRWLGSVAATLATTGMTASYANHRLDVHLGQESSGSTIVVRNILGKRVSVIQTLVGQSDYSIPFGEVSGVYYLDLVGWANTMPLKLIISN